MLESLFDKVAACYVIKKDANTDVSFKICKIFKIIYFEEHLLTAVSAAREKTVKFYLRLHLVVNASSVAEGQGN